MDNTVSRFKDFPDVLNVSQVSSLLQISEKTAYRLITDKEIDHIRIGRMYRVYKGDLLKYISNKA